MASNMNTATTTTFAQPEFKQELAQKAEETMQTETYQAEAHKAVALDCAVAAASKSDDLAKLAAADFQVKSESENMIDMAKEKLGGIASTISSAMESAKEKIGEMADNIQLPGSTNVTGTTPDHTGDLFAQSAFQQELAKKADETIQSDTYQAEAHKAVAMDCAVAAASKSDDLAKLAAADFHVKSDAENMIDMAKEKLGGIASTISGAMDMAKEQLGDMAAKLPIQMPGSTNVTGTTPDHTGDKFATTAFKQELAQVADEKMDTASFAYEEHKSVAKDAAVMAASKSGEFAKVAAAGFPAPKDEPEGMIEVAKEKIGETIDMAKDTFASTQQTVTGALGSAQATAGQAYSTTINTLGSTVEAAREKIGEGLEFAAEKMREAGDALSSQAMDTKEKGVQMQRSAELNSARMNLQPSTTI